MDALLFMLQVTKNSPDTGSDDRAAIAAGLVVVICVAMLVAAVRVVWQWPHEKKGMFAVGAVMISLPLFTLVFATTVHQLRKSVGENLDWWAYLLVPASWLIWLGFAVYAAMVYRAAKAEYPEDDDARQAEFEAVSNPLQPYSEFSPDHVIDADDPPEAGRTPRRAISIPAADSTGRASQQTLKRMSLEEVEQKAEKGPRAGEVPGNPILPDEVVKIRCLACDKKMKAEGSKFMKQRRCPACKAEPFRYVTAV